MDKNMRIVLNGAGVRKLLQSEEMKALCEKHAAAICARCGSGYEISTYTGKNRVNASVKAVTSKARRDNQNNNTLLKAMK
ncbi:MAG: hypothetical protein RSD23_08080 [Ruthenibacterium sp.]